MLTSTQLREQLGITQPVLTKLVRDGLPHTLDDRGRQKLFDDQAVARWLLDTGRATLEGEDQPKSKVARTRRECADHFGVHVRTVAEWLTDKTFPGHAGRRGDRDGDFPLDEIGQWIDSRDALRNGGPRVETTNKRDELLAVRIRRESVRTERDMLALEEDTGRLVSMEAMCELVTRQIHTAKKLLESLPDKAARDLPAELPAATRSAIVQRWRDGVYEVERTLSEMLADDEDEDEAEKA